MDIAEIYHQVCGDAGRDYDADYASGVVDSLLFLEFIDRLEARFGIRFSPDEFRFLDKKESIARLIADKTQGSRTAS